MSGLQLLSSYLTEVVKEILRVVEDTVTEHREEASRCRREGQTLRSQNQSLRSHNQTLTNQNQTLRSQLRDLLLLEARAEWPKAGQTHSFSLEQLSLSENSTSAVTPPTRCSVPAPQAKTPPTFPSVNVPQEPVVLPEQKQEEEQKELVLSPELIERKPLVSADVHKYHSERVTEGPRAAAEGPRAAAEGPQTTEGPRTAALSPAPVRVKEEPEEWSLTESEAEEPRGDQALSLTGLEREEDGEDGEEDGAEWREDDGGDWGGTNGAWKDLDLEETGLSLKPEDDPPSEAQTDRPPPTVTQMLPQSPPHSAPRCPQSHSAPRCPRCSEVFPSPAALLQHLHQAQKTHRCSFCCKSFSQSADLRRHHRTHTGERPHRCTFCSRAFSQRGNLRRHLRIHTGERPYGCLYCHRRFSDGDTLKKHLRTHSQGPQQDHSQGPRLQPGLNQV